MSTKIWENYCIGVLDQPNNDELPYRDSVFINNSESLQILVRIISETSYSFPNVKTVTCFYSDLEPWGFEDDFTLDRESRIERLKEWLEDYLLVFKVERKVRYNHEEVYNAKDVKIIAKLQSYRPELTLIPIPIFSKEKHEYDLDEFVYRLYNKKFVGRIEHISNEPDDTPAFVFWREDSLDCDMRIFGQIDKHQYAHGGFNFDLLDQLREIDLKGDWYEECYFCNELDDIVYVPLSIHQAITEELENAEPITIPSSEETQKSTSENIHTDFEAVAKAEGTNAVDSFFETAAARESAVVSNKFNLENDDELKLIETFFTNTQEAGLSYKMEDLINFHTAMKCSNLVILSGMSGTGKSRLVDLYSSTLGLKGEQFTLIPVSPSWTSDTDLIGYADTMHMIYRPGDSGLINSLRKAEDHPDKLFIICFDEMNLARVEHYFSQFLSILEMEHGKRSLRLYNDDLENRLYNSAQYPPNIMIKENVLFVGTINVDDSTYHFSDKVLDRANVISLEVMPFETLKNLPEKKKAASFRAGEIGYDAYQSFRSEHKTITLTDEQISLLWEVHQALQEMNRQVGVGPRIVKQIDEYLANLPNQNILSKEAAFDYQFVQRILTKVRGSEEQLRGLLGTYTDEGEINKSYLLDLLKRYGDVSSFEKSKKVIEQKAKELKFYGYTF